MHWSNIYVRYMVYFSEPELQSAQQEVEQLRQEVEKLKKYGENFYQVYPKLFSMNSLKSMEV